MTIEARIAKLEGRKATLEAQIKEYVDAAERAEETAKVKLASANDLLNQVEAIDAELAEIKAEDAPGNGVTQ